MNEKKSVAFLYTNNKLSEREISLLDSVGQGEGGMIWENGIETCIISCETNHQSRFDAGYRMLWAGPLR